MQLPSVAAIQSTVSFIGHSRHLINRAYDAQRFYVAQGARNATSQQPSLLRLRFHPHPPHPRVVAGR